MKDKRAISLCMLLFSLFNFTACEKTENAEVKVDLFDNEKALNISKDYLFNIKNGNIDGANKLCTDELLKGNVNIDEGISKISSFDKEKSIEGNNFAYYIYNIIRTSSTEPKSDLESLTIKVEKIEDQYLINGVKSQSKKELFVDGKHLRILEEEGSNSNLVVSLNGIPKDTYVSENDIMLYKAKVPNEAFGKVGLSFTGKKVAISTKGQEQAYICLANIEDSITTFMADNSAASGSNGENTMSQLEELFEKPIAKKIVSLDLLKDCEINNFIFSKKEDSLAVAYSKGNGVRRVNIYNANEGDIISKAINEEFNEAEYNIDELGFNAEEFIFNVSKVNSTGNADEKEGQYSFDIKSYEIKKL